MMRPLPIKGFTIAKYIPRGLTAHILYLYFLVEFIFNVNGFFYRKPEI